MGTCQKNGFTLIEVVVVFGIIATLAGVILSSSINFRSTTDVNSVVSNLITDIKSQQIKAMSGDTEGNSNIESFGVYFSGSKYTLFHGDTYSVSDPSNFDINLKTGLQIQTEFPDSTLIFSPKSGEIVSFSPGEDLIIVNDNNSSTSKTLQLNKYGSVISFN